MTIQPADWGFLRHLTWSDALYVAAALALARLLVLLVQGTLRCAAERARPHLRLAILRAVPISRLAIGVATIVIVVPYVVEPTFRNIATLAASIALALAFALKDYVSSLVAGVVVVLENTYQPGDWIELDGTYGEVKRIGLRAVRLVTADDTEVGEYPTSC